MTFTPPPLVAELPDEIFWLEQDIVALQRQSAVARKIKGSALKPGATRRSGIDIPSDATWAQGHSVASLTPHCADGLSCVLQLNLAEIPDEVRKPEWPREGVVWVFLQWGGECRARCQFDPRPAECIPWSDTAGAPGVGVKWELQVRLPWATDETLSSISYIGSDMAKTYDDWMWRHYSPRRRGRGVSVGGWGYPIQGGFDEDNRELVCSIEDLEFGDAGEVYLFYKPGEGFYASAETA